MGDGSRRRELRDAARLALIPIGVAVVLGLLLAPRRPLPDGVPLPVVDARALARVTALDEALAARSETPPLPDAVRALGSAIRDFHVLEARQADARLLGDARRKVDGALIEALGGGTEPLRALLAVQLSQFVREVRRFETTGEESDELQALAGGFIRSMQTEGWCGGHRLAANEPVLRVMFKEMWLRFLDLQATTELGPTLDEERALYAFYLSHAHPSRAMRDAIASARRAAKTERACQALDEAERSATEAWRLRHIERLAAIDPSYPADYARGIADYGRGEYRAAADRFRTWLDAHPEGPFTLRAQGFLRTAMEATRVD